MQENRPLLLISNDDGYLAGGILQLVGMLKPLADIVVVAPESGRSGAGMAISSSVSVTVNRISQEPGLTVFSCTGTPVDCIKLAIHSLVPRKPDLIVSGINYGDNSGVNAHYSGTMGVVLEGCVKGIPSIGFSSCDIDKEADFSPYTGIVQSLVAKVLERGLPRRTCLNVNFPVGGEFKGVKVARQDEGQWHGEWIRSIHSDGTVSYMLSGDYRSEIPDDETTDRWALDHGYIAITPTTIDLTDYRFADVVSEWFEV